MKSLLVSLLAVSVSTGVALAGCEDDSETSASSSGGDAGGGGADPVGPRAGSSAVGVSGEGGAAAGGAEAGGAGPGAAGMVGTSGAPVGGAGSGGIGSGGEGDVGGRGEGGGGSGGEGGGAPTFDPLDYRGYIWATMYGNPQDAYISLYAEFIEASTTPVQEQAVTDLVSYDTARAREDAGDDCIPAPPAFENQLDLPPYVARGATLILGSAGTDLRTATPQPVNNNPFFYIANGSDSVGPLQPDSFSFLSGSPLLGMNPDPVEVPVLQGGFVSTSFSWLSTDATFPLELEVVSTPPPGAHLVLFIGDFACRVPIPPNDADQGFIFNVPPAVVDTLPVAEEFFVSVEPLVARQVPVSDGWIRIETKNHFGFYVAGGTIDPP